MRAGVTRWRGAKAALALLGGLMVGTAAGAGTVWLVNRDKLNSKAATSASPEMPILSLGKADELDLVSADAMAFVHIRGGDLWKSEAAAGFRQLVEKAGPDAMKIIDDGFLPRPSSIDRVTVVLTRIHTRATATGTTTAKGGATTPKGGGATTPKKGGAEPPKPGAVPPPGGAMPPQPEPIPDIEGVEGIVILSFSEKFDAKAVRDADLPGAVKRTAGNKEYWYDQRENVAVHFPTDTVIVIGPESAITSFLTRPVVREGPLKSSIELAASGSRHAVAAANLTQTSMSDLRRQIPPEFASIGPIFDAQAVSVSAVLGAADVKLEFRGRYKDEAGAADAETALRAGIKELRESKGLRKFRDEADKALKGKTDKKLPRPVTELPEAVLGMIGVGGLNSLDEFLANLPIRQEKEELVLTLAMDENSGGVMGVTMAAGALFFTLGSRDLPFGDKPMPPPMVEQGPMIDAGQRPGGGVRPGGGGGVPPPPPPPPPLPGKGDFNLPKPGKPKPGGKAAIVTPQPDTERSRTVLPTIPDPPRFVVPEPKVPAGVDFGPMPRPRIVEPAPTPRFVVPPGPTEFGPPPREKP